MKCDIVIRFLFFLISAKLIECFTNIPTNIGLETRILSRSPWNNNIVVTQTRKSPLLKELYSASQGVNKNNNEKKQNPVKRVVQSIIRAQSQFRIRFSKLSKKAKILFCIQMLMFTCLVGGFVQKTVLPGGHSSRAAISRRARPVEVPYSKFMDIAEDKVKGAQVGTVVVSRDRVSFWVKQDEDAPARPYYALQTPASPQFVQYMRDNNLQFRAASTAGSRAVARTMQGLVIGVYCVIIFRMYSTMAGGSGSKGTGKLFRKQTVKNSEPLVSFDDIEGIDKAKFEVMELVDTLKNPYKYAILGARAPTGLLLYGPPGTGKTMLARATAAAAGVPMIYCSGSDFVEMFVGRGAARVRNTFERASKMAPCIVFIDELDALGKSRDRGALKMSSSDEADQTLNQLLACMDGLDSTKGVCVLAATNRKDVLDTALVRPGRFDRIIQLELPEAPGRENILRVHSVKLPGFTECIGVDEKRQGALGKGGCVDLSAVAAVTIGLSGAELEFIVNEAAIRAVRRVSSKLQEGKDPKSITPQVTPQDFELSVKDFYQQRKSGSTVGDIFDNVFRK